jgi:RNA processing factor Prp31
MTLSNETTKARVDFFTKNYDGKERLLDELDEMIDEIIEGRTSLED